MKCFLNSIIDEEDQEKAVHCKIYFRSYNKISEHKMENIKHEIKTISTCSFLKNRTNILLLSICTLSFL